MTRSTVRAVLYCMENSILDGYGTRRRSDSASAAIASDARSRGPGNQAPPGLLPPGTAAVAASARRSEGRPRLKP